MTVALQVFARVPVAGATKTRLIPRLGAAGAARWHDRSVRHMLATVGALIAPAVQPIRQLWFDGERHDPTLLDWCDDHPGFALYEQVDGDLGARMHAALSTGLARADAAVLVGTDCPLLDETYLRQAIAALRDGAELVLGPVDDGGYVLVGVRRLAPALFDGIAWGKDRVLAQTLDAARRQAIAYELLPSLFDVDRPQDLDRLAAIAPQFARWGA